MLKTLLFTIVICALGVLFFSNDFHLFSRPHPQSIGKVLSVSGLSLGKQKSEETFTNLSLSTPLTKTFYIVTGFDGEIQIEFGEKIKISPNSSVKLEKKAQSYLIYLTSGSIQRFEEKENVTFYYKEQKQSGLNIQSNDQAPMVEIKQAQLLNNNDDILIQTSNINFQKTLYETIKLHQRFLEKCFIKLYENKGGAVQEGVLLARLTVTPKGHTENISILESKITDKKFHKCIIEVLSRVRFKHYKGPQRLIDLPLKISLPK